MALPLRYLSCAALLVLAGGCESPSMRLLNTPDFLRPQPKDVSEANSHRETYQQERSGASMRWLLSHEVQTEMTVEQINRAIGEDGTRVYDDNWLKKGNGYQIDDVVYRWGPDRDGHNVYLVFRDGKLTNFDPDEFR